MRKSRHKRENCWEREAMKTDEWRYYHRAVIPRTPPHVVPDLRPIEEGSIWKIWGRGRPLLARWVTDFDCGYETNWWYVIKDTPFDIDALKAKRRYEITKGLKILMSESSIRVNIRRNCIGFRLPRFLPGPPNTVL